MSQQKTSPKRKKMNVGNITDCLSLADHHLEDGKLSLILFTTPPEEIESILKYRSRILREELEEVTKRIKRIKEIAKQHAHVPCVKEILGILNEQFEFGHDLSED